MTIFDPKMILIAASLIVGGAAGGMSAGIETEALADADTGASTTDRGNPHRSAAGRIAVERARSRSAARPSQRGADDRGRRGGSTS